MISKNVRIILEKLINENYIEYNEYIDSFFLKYPMIKNREPIFYLDKCGIISILLKNHIENKFNIKCKVIAGIGLNFNYCNTWVNSEIDKINIEIKNRKRTGHAVVLLDDNTTIYDITSRQFNKNFVEIYDLNEFEKRWNIIDYKLFSEKRLKDEKEINHSFMDELKEMKISYKLN